MDGSRNEFDFERLQAEWILGGNEPEELVRIAVSALQNGLDGTSLRQLAGLSQPTARELGNLPARIFVELGLQPIDRDEAVAILLNRACRNPVISALRQAFPEYADYWKRRVASWPRNSCGPYTDIGLFAWFVIEELYEKGSLDETGRAFQVLEGLLADADQDTKNLIGIGFLEDLQNIASWRPGGNRVYEQFFGPISKQIWSELQRIWAGKSSLADIIRAEQKTRNQP